MFDFVFKGTIKWNLLVLVYICICIYEYIYTPAGIAAAAAGTGHTAAAAPGIPVAGSCCFAPAVVLEYCTNSFRVLNRSIST